MPTKVRLSCFERYSSMLINTSIKSIVACVVVALVFTISAKASAPSAPLIHVSNSGTDISVGCSGTTRLYCLVCFKNDLGHIKCKKVR